MWWEHRGPDIETEGGGGVSVTERKTAFVGKQEAWHSPGSRQEIRTHGTESATWKRRANTSD